MNSQILSSIAALVEETIYTVNANPGAYIDSTGAPLTSDCEYTALDKKVIPVWGGNGTIYLVNIEQKSYFAFTAKEYAKQFMSASSKVKIIEK